MPVDRTPFLTLMAASAVSQVGNMMTAVAVPWLVFQETGSATLVGLTGAAIAIGAVAPAVLGGPLVDRFGPRRTSVVGDLLNAAAVAAIPFLHFLGVLQFWQLITLVFLLSLWPNHRAEQNARQEDLARVRLDLAVMSLVGLGLLVLRAFEFGTLHVRWDDNAYGSLVWTLLGLHTLHLLTDVGDTLVLTALMFTRHGRGKRFSDVEDNAFYWVFVVLAWLPIYALIYWAPRL